MNKYFEAEKRLAELLKFGPLAQHGDRLFWRAGEVPRWTRDNAAAFALMVGHEVLTTYEAKRVNAWRNNKPGLIISVDYDRHPDRETAVRYAIVMAVIAKLEAQRDQR